MNVQEDSNANEIAPESQSALPKMQSRRWALWVAIAAVFVSGIAHGVLDGRWVDRSDVERLGKRIEEVPSKVGDWELISDDGLTDQEQKILQCYGSLARTYARPSTGDRVTALLLMGPRGPMAVHRPEICFGGGGFEVAEPRVATPIGGDAAEQDELWVAKLKRNTDTQPSIEVWYGFSDGGHWHAAEHPRFWLTDRLYKVQVTGTPSPLEQDSSPVQDFVESFLPIVNGSVLRAG